MKDSKKQRLKKQLLSTGIYIALSAAVVGVTTSTIAKLLSDNEIAIPDAQNTKYTDNALKAPELPSLPKLDYNASSPETTPVSDTPEGISAQISEETPEEAQETAEQAPPQATVTETSSQAPDFGYSGYVKPCGSIISKEYTEDLLVYSPTMYDYRIHNGIDISADIGTPVKAVSGGIVTKVENHPMYGVSVTIDSLNGLCMTYANLSEQLVKGVEVDAVIKTGDVIGGIGSTALCESAEAPHLHLEASKNGVPFDPSSLFTEAETQEAANVSSTVAFE